MSFALKMVRSFIAAKCGSRNADALLDEFADIRKGPRPQMTAADLRTAIRDLPNARSFISYGLIPIRVPNPATSRPGLALVLDPAVRSDKIMMDELAAYGSWNLVDLY